MPDINYLSLLVAVATGFVVGVVWYGPLFGHMWQQQTAFSDKELEKLIEPGVLEHSLLHIVGLIVSAFILSYFVARNDAVTFLEGAAVGFLVWAVAASVLVLTGALHSKSQHNNVHVAIIDLGHWLVVFVSMAGVLAVF